MPPLESPAALLSNGRLTSLVTSNGMGFIRYDGIALNRWSGDLTENAEGFYLFVRDLDSGNYQSPWFQTRRAEAAAGRYSLLADFEALELRLDIAVSPDHGVEVRRVRFKDSAGRPRRIELTSYIEVVLNHPAADASHPAFSKLFVQTECEDGVLLARRRPRGSNETSLWMMHAALGGEQPEWETNRAAFLGRGYDRRRPGVMERGEPLTGTVGNVLDPVFALRRTLEIDADGEAEVCFLLGAAADREAALALPGEFPDSAAIDWIFRSAQESETQLCRELELSADRAIALQALAAGWLYGCRELRAPAELLSRAAGSPALLERYGLPAWIPLHVVIAREGDDPRIRELLIARRYWQARGLYTAVLAIGEACSWPINEGEPVFVRSGVDLPRNDFAGILAWARLVSTGKELELPAHAICPLDGTAVTLRGPERADAAPIAVDDLHGYNGYGGFTADGKVYRIVLNPCADGRLQRPPLAWINTIANERFGFLVSEAGAGYTWSRNSREHRLTPWSNDAITDPHGEAFYLRDEATGECWSPLPGPMPSGTAYRVDHGFGFTRFWTVCAGIEQETTLFVPRQDPLKIVSLALTNRSDQPRRLSVYSYQQWVLGGVPSDHSRFVVTDYDAANVLLATNAFAEPFADGVAFSSVVADKPLGVSYTGDRAAFLGRGGSPAGPAALAEPGLNGQTGAGLDPCAAFQVRIELAPGETRELAFLLGETNSKRDALTLVARYRRSGEIARALADAQAFWQQTLGAIQIQTPKPAIDLLVNGWVGYQNLVCRIFARSAFYQSGGAFGYRDQLQDSSALIYSRPDLSRAQLLLHAAHQFREGDVLHWWHPAPIARGLRTRFADDLVWLPFLTAFYVRTTGDLAILDEQAPYLTAAELQPGEDENYLTPADSGERGDLYDHCCRALDRAMTCGEHGLPLFGTGDWNDGMSRVGREGKGESVWMGFFLERTLADFLPLCERRGDAERIARYQHYRDDLAKALNSAGWDGEWYRRAYYDNGAVMGSKDSDECQIDALAQAWAVISGIASPERAASALDALESMLTIDPPGLIRLLTPAFVDTPNDPGYIKGYVAGVRENGGQYTHAACWVVRALAEAGRCDAAGAWLEKLSPVYHAATADDVAVYQVEPYVIVADIYGEPPHVGRGGWTWYTGSAGWYFRVALESVLGFTVENGDTLVLRPRIPDAWPQCRIRYTLPDDAGVYDITLDNPDGAAAAIISARCDGEPVELGDGALRIAIKRDGAVHPVTITLGAGSA